MAETVLAGRFWWTLPVRQSIRNDIKQIQDYFAVLIGKNLIHLLAAIYNAPYSLQAERCCAAFGVPPRK